jgi:hypothetical protein
MRTIASLYCPMSWRRLAAGGIVRDRHVVDNANPKRICAGKRGEKT